MKITIDNIDKITMHMSTSAKQYLEDKLLGNWYVDSALYRSYLGEGTEYPKNVRRTTVVIMKHGFNYYHGIAIFNPKDTFNELKGKKVAFQRALHSIDFSQKSFQEYIVNAVYKLFWDQFLEYLNGNKQDV